MVWGRFSWYPQFRLVVVSWCGGSILPCINGSGWWWWCHGVRNGLASNGGTHLPFDLQYQGWPAGAPSNQRLNLSAS
ncbi:unnamed protein product [Staurois parvus]|uniref:Secreted protein n=1 Tax=Staurois parvus TaxID=386267 RepID=A0ABN9GYS6_9NEOB|nr:unnamed protein product [Staurois parvus]